MPATKTIPPPGPDLLTELEDAGVDATQLEQVTDLIVIASALEGRAGLGSVVTVADRAGRVTEYELIAQPVPEDTRQRVTVDSETGRALLGARPGEYVRVTLANGRQRRVSVISVGSTPAEMA